MWTNDHLTGHKNGTTTVKMRNVFHESVHSALSISIVVEGILNGTPRSNFLRLLENSQADRRSCLQAFMSLDERGGRLAVQVRREDVFVNIPAEVSAQHGKKGSLLIIQFAVVGFHPTSHIYWQSSDEPGDVELIIIIIIIIIRSANVTDGSLRNQGQSI